MQVLKINNSNDVFKKPARLRLFDSVGIGQDFDAPAKSGLASASILDRPPIRC